MPSSSKDLQQQQQQQQPLLKTPEAATGRDSPTSVFNSPAFEDRTEQRMAHAFETEVNSHHNNHFLSSLCNCKVSGNLRQRTIAYNDGRAPHLDCEFDTFGYIDQDERLAGADQPDQGYYLVKPPGSNKTNFYQQAAESRSLGLQESPGVQERMIRLPPKKAVIGETYSKSAKAAFEGKKIPQLERAVAKYVIRSLVMEQGSDTANEYLDDEQKNLVVPEDVDPSSVVGAAILTIISESQSRSKTKDQFLKSMNRYVTKSETPCLWRLARAKRLFLCVLSKNDAPVTSFMSSVSSSFTDLGAQLARLELRFDRLELRFDRLERRTNIFMAAILMFMVVILIFMAAMFLEIRKN